MSDSKFCDFSTKDFVYKTVNGHDLETTVCVPKKVSSGKRPVLVHLHGGFLIIGDKMFEPWWAKWLVQFAESKGAIVVSPNYRLLPEATGKDIMEDLADFYDWVKKSLPVEVTKMHSGTEVDLNKILVAGESAGGYLAAQSALSFPDMRFSAVISQYGMIDMEHHHFTQAGHKDMNGSPQMPSTTVDHYVESIKSGGVRSSTEPPQLWSLIVEMVRQGRMLEFLGEDKTLLPMKLLDEANEVPPFWIVNGQDDELVPPEISENFLNKLKETHPQTPVFHTSEPGPHGFDSENVLTDAWVKEGCEFISKYWT